MKKTTQGTVTTPQGFLAGATYVGLKGKSNDALDLGVLYSEEPCVAAGVFTTNRVKAAPVLLCQEQLKMSRSQALVVNSGCANACTGKQGLADAQEMVDLTARKLGISPQNVLVSSTGVIGKTLPMEKIRRGIESITLSQEGGHSLARAIITTDHSPKEIAVKASLEPGGSEISIGGIAKGAGMIHPNMATLLGFIATDAAVSPEFLKKALKRATNDSFNMITVDGDTSPNDSVIILANGHAENKVITDGTPASEVFQAALNEVCIFLARELVRGGEGATKLIEVTVDGALTITEARRAARVIAGSALVKAAVHGADPNWGRIVAAMGRSGVEMIESRIDLYLDNICMMKAGQHQPFNHGKARSLLRKDEVPIRACLNLGNEKATAWGCDLSEEYVTINSEYTT
ncbi:bifunctional glutamate N-acetyltransferase/amino-acid acetyltransferase ArgJ [Chloroflexota bacterium]